ncbi:nitrous-oxide reductase [Ardenticatena maritima]|uniref:Nitrous-oxide reductase n=1 Tax=Ardenticatena maritima TaxID=872965 RepID=A0A0M9UC71_9CHLR|nr:Sec-dependent nitrous-oxide reductase [Ardenticatena maritima]GAP62557.1 nitrous-oxide reductase [Ardenticatena maritima]
MTVQDSRQKYTPYLVAALVVVAVLAVVFLIIRNPAEETTAEPTTEAQTGQVALSGDAQAIAEARGLSPDDVVAALKTYVPSGQPDEYVIFSSGGHSGQVLVIGVPSMRLLKVIGVFTPEPWQGWGYGAESTMKVLEEGRVNGRDVLWADTHHPALSETNGDYDGDWLFINDKANARVAVIDLRDFETKQIVKNPIALNDHGGTMVTPNTDWVIEGGQYAAPLGWKYASLDQYAEEYRGMVTFWKFDRESGRILPEESFALELPPYWQDLCDAGKKVSDGWVFCNSFNTEMATGGVEEGNPPFEAGASQRDMDYLHIINLNKAAELVAAGKYEEVNGFKVLPLDVLTAEKVLFFAPEPKSPHGVDVAPNGDYLVVSGKLDPHVTVYSFEKIMQAIEAGPTETDEYGVPILNFDDVVEAQVEVGLGPLHTQFDNQGYAYTSLFLDSAVARWTLGGDYAEKNPDEPWTLVSKIPVNYNIGHLVAAEGDTVDPDGKYLVALNKWAIDRFVNVGPLLPQNFQLIDISQPGTQMQLLYDMPIGLGEPHYAQMIKADKLHAWEVYPEVGWDPHTQSKSPYATMPGEERVERNGNTVEIWMTAVRSHFTPEHIEIKKGDHVIWHITNIERAKDATHGFALPGYNINLSIEPGETVTFEFDAVEDGVFSYYCTEFCSALHLEMTGYLLVQP